MYKTKYILIISLFISLFSCDNLDLSNEQANTFKKVLGSGNSVVGKDVIEYDGGFILLATCTHNTEKKDIVLFRTDRFGNQRGSADTLALSIRGGNNTASKLIKTNDGGFIVLGTVEDVLNTDTSNTDIYINKFTSSSVSEWEQYIGKSYDEEGNAINEEGAAIKKSNNGYIIAGNIDENTDENDKGKDIYLVKVDDFGVIEGEPTSWEADGDGYASDILTLDNGYLIIGTTSFPGKGSEITFYKTNQEGTANDEIKYGGTNNDFGTTAVRTVDGGYIIVGKLEEDAGGNSNIKLLKVDEGFRNIIWNRDIGGTALNDEAFKIIKSNVGYIIVGTKELASGPAAYFIKIDGSNGETLVENTYGGYDQTINSIISTSDGSFIMIGSSGADGNEMIYLLKVNSEGEL